MKLYLVILLCAAYATCGCDAAVALRPNTTHPDHPGSCYEPEHSIAFKPGEQRQLANRCTIIDCSQDFTIDYTTCGISIITDPQCEKVERDYSLDYPECCKQYKCDRDGVITME